MWVRFVGVDCCFILLLCWFVWFSNADLLGWNARVCVGLIWAYVSSWGLVFCWIAWCLGLIFEFGFLRGCFVMVVLVYLSMGVCGLFLLFVCTCFDLILVWLVYFYWCFWVFVCVIKLLFVLVC